MALSSRKPTATKQEKLLANFYKQIYQGEQNFVTNEEVSAFVDEDEPDDNIHEDDVVETETGVDGKPVIDLNRDEEAPEDEHETAILWKKKFSNYEKMHDSSNYDQLPDQEEETFVWSKRAGDCYKWCKLKKDVLNNIGCGRRSAANFCSSGGPTTKAQRNVKSPVDTWSLMTPDDEVMKIVNYTNKKITELHDIIGERLRETDKKNHYKLTSLTEMKAWFGLLYLRAALKLNKTDTDIVWYHESSTDIFSATMQRKRFTFLTRAVQFNDAEMRKERWNHNKSAAFHEYFEAVNHNFLKLQKLSPHMAIDQTLYSYHRRISLKHYSSDVCMIQWSNSTMYHFHMLGSQQVRTSTT